jgi:hypothetical protein
VQAKLCRIAPFCHAYLISYDQNSHPLEVVRVLSGYRDIAALLES